MGLDYNGDSNTVNVDTIEGKQESSFPFPVKESFFRSESDD